MRSPASLFRRLMRKAQVATGVPLIAVSVQPMPDGALAGAWTVEAASLDDVEFAALTILEAVIHGMADADPDCPCCADRMARAKAAIAALKPDLAEPAAPIISLH